MQADYLQLLSPAVQAFVEEVEAVAGLALEVVPSAELNNGGPYGQGKLSIDIESQSIRLNVPTNGYFPDGAVRHEVLHAHRLHVAQVPRLAVAENADWDPAFESGLTQVDNALEHLVIVPTELQHHPERLAHWDAVMSQVWGQKLAQSDPLDRRIGACLHWAFLRHVAPASPALEIAIAFLQTHNLTGEADAFADQLVPRLGNKVDVAHAFFDWFVEVPKTRVALEYVSSLTGTTQVPLVV